MKKMILSRPEVAAFERIEDKKDSLEVEMQNMLRNLMVLHEEDMAKIKEERNKLWTAVHTRFNLDPDNFSYALNRNTGEITILERGEDPNDSDEDYEDDDCDSDSEHCGDPDCTACEIKRVIKAKVAAGPPTADSLMQLIQEVGEVIQGARSGEGSTAIKVRTPRGLMNVTRGKSSTTVH